MKEQYKYYAKISFDCDVGAVRVHSHDAAYIVTDDSDWAGKFNTSECRAYFSNKLMKLLNEESYKIIKQLKSPEKIGISCYGEGGGIAQIRDPDFIKCQWSFIQIQSHTKDFAIPVSVRTVEEIFKEYAAFK